VNVDLVIAGRRIRLCSHEGVIIRPDDRFRAFTVPEGVRIDLMIDTIPGILSEADPWLTGAGIPFMTDVARAGQASEEGLQEGSYSSPGNEGAPDLTVEVCPGSGQIPPGAVKVFDAQLMEEIPGGVVNSGEPFWEIFSGEGVTCARVFLKDPERTALLVMPHGEKQWRIFTGEHRDDPVRHQQPGTGGDLSEPVSDSDSFTGQPDEALSRKQQTVDEALSQKKPTVDDALSRNHPTADDLSEKHSSAERALIILNPLPYPLDGLLLYFLFSRAGDIMIHGSGVSCHGRGWLFTGRSGSGKTTLARIFDQGGDRVIHDDRLVLRRQGKGWVMHNTPVYRNDEPRSAALDHLWIIRHGSANVSEPVIGAEAVAMILANCIQQNWDREAAVSLVAAAEDLASSVKVSRLSFLPDDTVRDYLRLRKEEDISVAAVAAEAMLRAGKEITVTAGGYSMWPVIRPGDAVVIAPYGEGAAAAGRIVALRRDGGFVLHRITRVMTVSGRELIVTCGDAAARADEPAGPATVAGVVISVTRRGRQFPPPRRRTPRLINRGWAILDRVIRSRLRKIT